MTDCRSDRSMLAADRGQRSEAATAAQAHIEAQRAYPASPHLRRAYVRGWAACVADFAPSGYVAGSDDQQEPSA